MHSGKFTKIIATIGPSCSDENIIKDLILSGVNFFRFNLKHADLDWHLKHIDKVRKVGKRIGVTVGIIVDLLGPEVVIKVNGDKELTLKKSSPISLSQNTGEVYLYPEKVTGQIKNGDVLVVDDGKIELIADIAEGKLRLVPLKDGYLLSGKGVSLKGGTVDVATLSEDEKLKINELVKISPDFFAVSFVRSSKDIIFLADYLKKSGSDSGIISKIETQTALDDLDAIVNVSDGVMVARGDLGIEVSLEKITFYQKKIIEKCRANFKPVIVATQMLESMTDSNSPTRAEVSDVSNAVRDGVDAVMLSGETAVGEYPVETVKMMHRIVSFNEKAFNSLPEETVDGGRTYSIVKAAADIISSDSSVSKILVATETGRTARIFSSLRPKVPIIALTQNEKTLRELGLSYGVLPYKIKFPEQGLVNVSEISQNLKERGILTIGENIIIVHGSRWQDRGNTNSLYIFGVN